MLPGNSTFTMSLTSGKFDTRLFSMAAAIKDKATETTDHAWRTESSYVMSTGEHLKLDSNYSAVLLHTPVANSVYIPGMTQTAESNVSTGKFKITTTDGVTTITFASADFNDEYEDYVDVVYDYYQEVKEAIVTNKESAIGEAVCIWPVKNIRGFAA